jgi:serine-type D-Ala-D-Ala carboxypeptidase (penicillin-binding protein 5/6)
VQRRRRSRGRSRVVGTLFLIASVIILGGVVWLTIDRYDIDPFEPVRGLVLFGDQDSAVDTLPPTPKPTPTPLPRTIPADVPLSARAAIVIDVDAGAVLFERDADEPLQPASTIKIITALTVLRHATLEEVIRIEESDVVDPVAESSMGLQAGDMLTIYNLLVGLMLPSGNDAANALARHVGGRLPADLGETPQDRFVAEMNAVAAEIGMNGSHLSNPSGHDRDDQSVTARDMTIAAMRLLERPSLMPIVAMDRAEIRVGGEMPRVLTIWNTNELLRLTGVHGVKTGTTNEAGQCLVVAYRDGERTLLAVILGSTDRYGDARALLGLPEPPPPPPDDEEIDPESE